MKSGLHASKLLPKETPLIALSCQHCVISGHTLHGVLVVSGNQHNIILSGGVLSNWESRHRPTSSFDHPPLCQIRGTDLVVEKTFTMEQLAAKRTAWADCWRRKEVFYASIVSLLETATQQEALWIQSLQARSPSDGRFRGRGWQSVHRDWVSWQRQRAWQQCTWPHRPLNPSRRRSKTSKERAAWSKRWHDECRQEYISSYALLMSVNTKMEHRTLAWALVITGTRVYLSESVSRKDSERKNSKSKPLFYLLWKLRTIFCNFRWRPSPYPFPNPIFTSLKPPYLNRNHRR